jgi:hypothetical protein
MDQIFPVIIKVFTYRPSGILAWIITLSSRWGQVVIQCIASSQLHPMLHVDVLFRGGNQVAQTRKQNRFSFWGVRRHSQTRRAIYWSWRLLSMSAIRIAMSYGITFWMNFKPQVDAYGTRVSNQITDNVYHNNKPRRSQCSDPACYITHNIRTNIQNSMIWINRTFEL